MDDFNLSTLTESRNEYCALLITKLTPCIVQGIYSIFNESCDLCIQNDEDEKYLMTFQNLLGRVTRWNKEIIQLETERIIKESNCNYLEDLITCVHVTQLKILTNIRAGSKQKKITIDIPKIDEFIHKCYIQSARKVYKSVFLFDKSAMPLSRQKNLRELETIIKECILSTLRENMPIEDILKAYLEEGDEVCVDEEKTEVNEVEEEVEDDKKDENIVVDKPDELPNTNVKGESLKFNNTDVVLNFDDNASTNSVLSVEQENKSAPKDISTLEKISTQRNEERKLEEQDDDDDSDNDSDKLTIFGDVSGDDIKLDIEKIAPDTIQLKGDSDMLGEIEILK